MRDVLVTNKEAKLCDGFLFLIDAKWDCFFFNDRKASRAIYESRMFRETASRHISCPWFLLSMLQQRRVVGLKADVHKACAAFSDGEFNRIRKRTMKKKKSSVLRARRLSGKVLTFLLGAEDDALREFADDSKTGRAGKTLVKEDSLRITFVALKKGTVLPSHRVAVPSVSRPSVDV